MACAGKREALPLVREVAPEEEQQFGWVRRGGVCEARQRQGWDLKGLDGGGLAANTRHMD